MEAAVDELPVVLLLHFAEEVGSILGLDDTLLLEIVILGTAELQGTRHI